MAVVLGIHNLIRWVILIAALFTAFRMLRGIFTRSSWSRVDRIVGTIFTISLDTQLLLGIMLYFIFSPMVKTFLSDIGAAMQNPVLRFWGLEHVSWMIVAVILGHVGNAFGKKDIPDREKFTKAGVFFLLTIAAILLGMPWQNPLLPSF